MWFILVCVFLFDCVVFDVFLFCCYCNWPYGCCASTLIIKNWIIIIIFLIGILSIEAVWKIVTAYKNINYPSFCKFWNGTEIVPW